MATGNPASSPRRRRLRRVAFLALALAALLLGWFWTPLNGYVIAGTSYGARVACSCRFVGGRDLGDCKKDFEPGMELVMLSQDSAAKSITATFPLLASQTARFKEGEGCKLDPWQG